MNSGEIAAWIGDAITFLAFVSFLIVERDRLFSHKKAIQPDSASSNLIDIGLIDNLRSLIYTRILIGIILGFALSRALPWIVEESETLGGSLYNLNLPLVVTEMLVISIAAIALGLFFGIVYFKVTPNLKTMYHHWIERTLVAFVLISILASGYNIRWSDFSEHVYGPHPLWAMLVGVVVMLLLSFPLSPVEIIMVLVKKAKEFFQDKDKKSSTKNKNLLK